MVKINDKAVARMNLSLALRELFEVGQTTITFPASSWGKGADWIFTVDSLDAYDFSIALAFSDDTGVTDVDTLRSLPRLIKRMWSITVDRQFLKESNMRHYRVIEKLKHV